MTRCALTTLVLLTFSLVSATAEAQWVRTKRPIERVDRFLGIGWGAGYHWRTPGPDSSYYSPYSDLNIPGTRWEPLPSNHPAPKWPPLEEPGSPLSIRGTKPTVRPVAHLPAIRGPLPLGRDYRN